MRGRLLKAVVATGVVGLVLTLLSLAVARSGEERDQIQRADSVADQLIADLDLWAGKATSAVARRHERQAGDYAGLLRLVEKRLDKAPQFDKQATTAYGRQNSRQYRSAVERRKLVVAPLNDLRVTLEREAVSQDAFVQAGKALVEISTARLLEDVPVITGQVLLDIALPAYEQARDDVDAQEVPAGQELLGIDLATFADDAVSDTEQGAAEIDAGNPFFFNFGERREKLYARLTALEAQIAGTVSQAVDGIAAGSTT